MSQKVFYVILFNFLQETQQLSLNDYACFTDQHSKALSYFTRSPSGGAEHQTQTFVPCHHTLLVLKAHPPSACPGFHGLHPCSGTEDAIVGGALWAECDPATEGEPASLGFGSPCGQEQEGDAHENGVCDLKLTRKEGWGSVKGLAFLMLLITVDSLGLIFSLVTFEFIVHPSLSSSMPFSLCSSPNTCAQASLTAT